VLKRNLSPNGSPKNGTVKNGSLKKTERASNGMKIRSVMMITQMKMMKNSMTKTKITTTKMSKIKKMKKIRKQDLVVSLSHANSLSSLKSEFKNRGILKINRKMSSLALKNLLVMSAPQLKNLPVRSVLSKIVMRKNLSPGLREPRMKTPTKNSSEIKDLMTSSLNTVKTLTDVSIYLG